MASGKIGALAGLRMLEEKDEDGDQAKPNTDTSSMANPKEPLNPTNNDDVSSKNILVKDAAETDVTTTVNLLPTALKPLKSILKRRKPEECDAIASEKEKDIVEDTIIEKPKVAGGSIAQALRMIKEVKSKKVDNNKQDDNNDPKPSAFILEMEKQRDNLTIPFSGALGFPTSGNVGLMHNMDWEKTSIPGEEPKSFFLQEKRRKKMNQNNKKRNNVAPVKPYTIAKPPELNEPSVPVICKQPMAVSPEPENLKPTAQLEQDVESVMKINNLPFKVTNEELVFILGIWPKGGYRGINVITDKLGNPTGYAYVILDRHSDMMDVLRMTGLEMQGRKLHVAKSSRERLIADWLITKKAKAMIEHSRVVKIRNLSYHLRKSELIDTLNCVKFDKNDIYWKELKAGQSNSGRGYVVLRSSKDAKSLVGKNYTAKGRKIDISVVHPKELMAFLKQCDIGLDGNHVLHDTYDEKDYENYDDLELSAEAPIKTSTILKTNTSNTNFVVVDETGKPIIVEGKIDLEIDGVIKDIKGKGRNVFSARKPPRPKREIERRPQQLPPPRNNIPPFIPTVHVRMYDVPDKATTADVRSFFEPVLPAKIAQNIGYDIYDIEFYNPGEAMQAMKKHMLLMRKNIIKLEMLPGPPHPLPPRRGPPPRAKSPHHEPMMMLPGMVPPMIAPGMEPGPPGVNPMDFGRRSMIHRVPAPMLPHMNPMTLPQMGPGPMLPNMGPGPPPMTGPISRMLPGPDLMHVGRPITSTRNDHLSGPLTIMNPNHSCPENRSVINPSQMPKPMIKKESKGKDRTGDVIPEPQKELIPVPPLPEDYTTYRVPHFRKDTPVGQGVITPMQGYFCQLCNKFYSSRNSAKVVHCKSKNHYERLKQFLQEKKRLRKLAESEVKAS